MAAEVDPAEEIEVIKHTTPDLFPGEFIISPKEQALEEAKAPRSGQVLWSDGSKLEDGRTGAAAVCCKGALGLGWKSNKAALGKNKEVFDAEL